MTKQKPIEVKPPAGGRLLSAISVENVGIYNYTIKRDIRRFEDREVRSEGHVYFCPKIYTVDDLPTIVMPPTSDPITLIIMLRHPNGRRMVIVGTATTLWRYYGVENPLYYDAGYYDAGYYEETSVAWKEIGSGFSSTARRWECETVNGYLILNNGADLPMTYRITDDSVTPIYELRELAVASVGTILVQDSHLLCMDIRQIKEDKFIEIMTPIDSAVNGFVAGVESSSPDIAVINSGSAGVAGNRITASGSSFNGGAGFIGMDTPGIPRTIRMLNGDTRTIVSSISATVAIIDGAPLLIEPGIKFFIPRSDAFLDFYYDTALQPAWYSIFPGLDIGFGKYGQDLYWDSGETGRILVVYTDILSGDPYFLLQSDRPIPSGPLKIENPLAYKRFTDESYLDRYQNRVIHSLPDQPRRFGATCTATISPQSDIIEFDYPVKSIGLGGGEVTMTGMLSGNLTAVGVYYDGLRMMVGGGAIRKFYSAVLEALEAARLAERNAESVVVSTAATLQSALDSMAASKEALAASPSDSTLSQEVAAASAAVDAARSAKNLADTSLIAAVAARVEAESKSLESESIELQLSDSLTTTSRLDDLQNDGAAILKAVSMKTVAVIFTETAIFIARYVASIGTFTYKMIEVQENQSLFYRNTPILVNGSFVLYAAENQFCRFDLTNQIPVDIPIMRMCADLFFDQATPENIERIFTFDNPLTSEIYICFPSDSDDKALRLDYSYETVSSTSAEYTAGSSVKFPGTDKGVQLVGSSNGKVLRLGLVAGENKKLATASGSKTSSIITAATAVFSEIHVGYSARFASGQRFGITKFIDSTHVEVVGSGNVTAQSFWLEPTSHHRNGESYTSVLQSGGDAFKSEAYEKKMGRYSVALSSFSVNTQLAVIIRSGRSANEMSDKISTTITPPNTLVPVILSDHFIGDRIEVSGINNPVEISGRIFHISGAASASFGRRVV